MNPSSLIAKSKLNSLSVAPDSPLLWVLRDTLGVTGAKFRCEPGLRGARTDAGTSR